MKQYNNKPNENEFHNAEFVFMIISAMFLLLLVYAIFPIFFLFGIRDKKDNSRLNESFFPNNFIRDL